MLRLLKRVTARRYRFLPSKYRGLSCFGTAGSSRSAAAGVLFILFGICFLLKKEEEKAAAASKRSVFLAAFALFFVSEFGEKAVRLGSSLLFIAVGLLTLAAAFRN